MRALAFCSLGLEATRTEVSFSIWALLPFFSGMATAASSTRTVSNAPKEYFEGLGETQDQLQPPSPLRPEASRKPGLNTEQLGSLRAFQRRNRTWGKRSFILSASFPGCLKGDTGGLHLRHRGACQRCTLIRLHTALSTHTQTRPKYCQKIS